MRLIPSALFDARPGHKSVEPLGKSDQPSLRSRGKALTSTPAAQTSAPKKSECGGAAGLSRFDTANQHDRAGWSRLLESGRGA
jgi:hypothetical protein